MRHWIVAVALVATTAPVSAQGLSLTPTIGVYAPTADLADAVIQGQPVTLRQQVGMSLGARLGLFLGPRVSAILTGQYVPSDLQAQLTDSGAVTGFAGKTDLWFGSARLAVWLMPPTSAVFINLNGGVGLAGRGESTIAGVTSGSRTDVTGVVGTTIGFRLGGLGLALTVDDYIYKPQVFGAIEATPKTQNDLQISVGLGVPLSR